MTATIDRGRGFCHYKALNTPLKARLLPYGWSALRGASMRVLRPLALFGLVVAAPAYADGISGTYVEKASDGAVLVQVVQTSDGHLTGRLEMIALRPSGELVDMNALITGASDGHTLVISVQPTNVSMPSRTISGTVDGTLMSLKGGLDLPDLSLTKSDAAEFNAQVAILRDKAGQINRERVESEARQRQVQAQTDLLARLNKLTQDMLMMANASDAQLEKFPPIQQRYRTITGLMSGALSREQSIIGDGQASVARSQVAIAINQAGIETEQLHMSLQDAIRDMGGKVEPILKDGIDMKQRCQSVESSQSANLYLACVKFQDAGRKISQSMGALNEAFRLTEKVWMEEHRKQEGIVRASETASR
jgi:hypothetical protein